MNTIPLKGNTSLPKQNYFLLMGLFNRIPFQSCAKGNFFENSVVLKKGLTLQPMGICYHTVLLVYGSNMYMKYNKMLINWWII